MLVVLCGVTHSGKSTLAARDAGLRTLTRIEADGMRNLIARRPHDLRRVEVPGPSPFDLDASGPLATTSPVRAARRSVLVELTDAVFAAAFAEGIGVVHDASNKTAAIRTARLGQARAAGYRTAVVLVTCPEEVVRSRLRAHDDALEAAGQPRFWEAEHDRHHAGHLELPTADEADQVLAVPYDTTSLLPLPF